MNSDNICTLVCKTCNKTYKTRQSLWNHVNKYHKTDGQSKVSQTDLPVSQKSAKKDLPDVETESKYTCNYCGTSYKHKQSKFKHQQKCKINNQDFLHEQLKKQSEEINEMKNLLKEMINKNCKVHPKTLQKINKQLNGDNNTINENNITNNNNNITNNNTFNVIALGHENLTEVFSKKEKMNILKYKYGSLPQLVEYAHFKDKFPQFKNILITNTQNTIGYKYNEKKKQYVATKKDDLLEDIVDARMCDINSFYEELEGELDEKTKDILDKLKEQIEKDSAYRDLKKNDIKLIIYNNRKKVTKEIKYNSDIEV